MENLTELITAVISTGIITTIVTHLITKKKFVAEVAQLKSMIKSNDIDNMDKSLDFYEKFVEATNKRLDEVLNNQNKLITENNDLKNQIMDVNTRMAKLTSVICTKLTCVHREVDDEVIDCIYPKKDKELRKLVKKSKKL